MLQVPPKTPTETYNSTEFTDGVSQECQNAIIDSGQTLNGSNLFQQKEAILRYGSAGQEYVDSGGVNTYVLTSIQPNFASTAYIDGMIVNFVATNTSTGSSTVNVNGLGVKTVVNILGNPTIQHTLIGGRYITLRYDSSADKFFVIDPYSPTTIKAFAYVTYNGPNSNGQNPFIQRSENIATIGSVPESGGFVWEVTYTTPINLSIITATPFDTNGRETSRCFVAGVSNTEFQIWLYDDLSATYFLNGFMFTVI